MACAVARKTSADGWPATALATAVLLLLLLGPWLLPRKKLAACCRPSSCSALMLDELHEVASGKGGH
jgi:hypothetical protein